MGGLIPSLHVVNRHNLRSDDIKEPTPLEIIFKYTFKKVSGLTDFIHMLNGLKLMLNENKPTFFYII